jgi:lipopolysaccharide biosynthesis glycosyltransferase
MTQASAAPLTSIDAPIALVLSADEAFGMAMGVTLHSALYTLRTERAVEVYVLDGGLAATTRARVRRIAEGQGATITFVPLDPGLYTHARLRVEERFSPSTFARIHMDRILPDHIPRAVYLDSDIVVEKDLSRLWSIPFEGNVLLAVQDQFIPYVSARYGVKRWRALGLPADTPFFNSGMLVVNLPRYRQEHIGAQIFQYLLNHGDELNLRGNQEGFNAVLADRWTPLDLRWNVLHVTYDPARCCAVEREEGFRVPHERLTRDPYVIHYTDDSKPWDPTCMHPARGRFLWHLRQSGYFSPTEYAVWRTSHSTRHFMEWTRQASRPLRHTIGLRKRSPTSG